MLLQKAGYSLHRYEQRYADDAAKLITESFRKLNPIWKAYDMPYDKGYKYVRFKIIPLLSRSLSFVLMDSNEKIVGCTMNIDLRDLRSLLIFSVENQIEAVNEIEEMELFTIMSQVNDEFFKNLLASEVMSEGSIYNYYGAIDESINNLGLANYMFHRHILLSKGGWFKAFLWKNYQPNNLQNYAKNGQLFIIQIHYLGAKEVNRQDIDIPEKGLNNYTTYLVYIDLTKFKLYREHL